LILIKSSQRLAPRNRCCHVRMLSRQGQRPLQTLSHSALRNRCYQPLSRKFRVIAAINRARMQRGALYLLSRTVVNAEPSSATRLPRRGSRGARSVKCLEGYLEIVLWLQRNRQVLGLSKAMCRMWMAWGNWFESMPSNSQLPTGCRSNDGNTWDNGPRSHVGCGTPSCG